MNIISELYHGKIRPFEQTVQKNSEYLKQAKNFCHYYDALMQSASEGQTEIIEKLCRAQDEINSITAEEFFTEGFRTAMRLTACGLLSESGEFAGQID